MKRLNLGYLATILLGASVAQGQLLENLTSLTKRVEVDDKSVAAERGREGPKSLVAGDFDQDGQADFATANLDGTLSLIYGEGGGEFEAPVFVNTGGISLRGMVSTDLNEDGFADFVIADPFQGNVKVLVSSGAREFADMVTIEHWVGVRAVETGDFNGDENVDIAVAGPVWEETPDFPGLRILLGDGAGGFSESHDVHLANRILSSDDCGHLSRPVHVIASFRPHNATKDSLVIGHQDSRALFVYYDTGDVDFRMETHPHDISVIAPIEVTVGDLSDGQLGGNDLVVLSKDQGQIKVYHGGLFSGENPWPAVEPKTISVPGAPRSVEIVDMNNDGRNDLVVVLRNINRVVVFENTGTGFEPTSEIPTGSSPRQVATAELNGDGLQDVLVMNRSSQDVTVLLSNEDAGGVGVSNQMYPVDGQVVQLDVTDLNEDARDDVIQLHTASQEVSVRLAQEHGLLGEAVCYPTGVNPISFLIQDLNRDGIKDIIVTNLGRSTSESSFNLMLGVGDGSFTALPEVVDNEGRMFAVNSADFDGDGIEDLVIGYFDCRVVFYRGTGDGTYERTQVQEFIYESRAMVTGDFDQDGDLDLAGVGARGDIVVLTNNGDFMTGKVSDRKVYETNGRPAGVPNLRLEDRNGDEDPDLLLVSSQRITVLVGGEGTTFTQDDDLEVMLEMQSDDSAVLDFDRDGIADLMLSCQIGSCLNLYRGTEERFEYLGTLPVPSGSYLAAGDLDGDGFADLVGTGSALWTALSTPPPAEMRQVTNAERRETVVLPVINEIIASNRNLVIPGYGNGTPDVVEIFYGGEGEVDLSGWSIRLETADEVRDFEIPTNTILKADEQLLIIFDDTVGRLITGFKLPREGATVTLINNGETVDQVTYPELPEDTSFSRYADGFSAFTLNSLPDPGLANQDNGAVDPDMKFQGLRYDFSGETPRLMVTATATDDVGVFTLTMNYRRIDGANGEVGSVILVDDGMSGDRGMADGFFAADLTDLLPVGAEIEFFFTVVDLMGEQKSEPGRSYFSPLGQPTEHFKMRLGEAELTNGLQISEVVSKNKNGLREETGRSVDWIEVRNTGAETISLNGVMIVKEQFGDEPFEFPEGTTLDPGAYLVVFADNDPQDGPLHAPFRIDADGDSLMLVSRTAERVEELLSIMDVPALGADLAWARLGRTETAIIGQPTPGLANGPDRLAMIRRGNSFLVVFPTESGMNYQLQESASFLPESWGTIEEVTGDNIEHVYRGDFGSRQFFRLQEPADQAQ